MEAMPEHRPEAGRGQDGRAFRRAAWPPGRSVVPSTTPTYRWPSAAAVNREIRPREFGARPFVGHYIEAVRPVRRSRG